MCQLVASGYTAYCDSSPRFPEVPSPVSSRLILYRYGDFNESLRGGLQSQVSGSASASRDPTQLPDVLLCLTCMLPVGHPLAPWSVQGK